jgi:hypothetical protein
LFFEIESNHVAQAGLKLLSSSDPPASAVCHLESKCVLSFVAKSQRDSFKIANFQIRSQASTNLLVMSQGIDCLPSPVFPCRMWALVPAPYVAMLILQAALEGTTFVYWFVLTFYCTFLLALSIILFFLTASTQKQAEFMEMKSSLKHLENLVAQQSKDFQQLCEQLGQLNVPGVLEEIKRLILVPQVPKHVKDSTSQTSPSLTQSLNFTRQEKYTSEESGTWQAQAPSDARNSNTGFLKPGEFAVWDEGAKSDGLQEETVLPAVGPPKGDGYVKKAITKISPKNHGSSIPGYKVCGDRDLFSQNASQLISQDLNNFATTIRNVCPKYQAQCMFSYDPCEQLVTEQKGRTVGRGRKGKKPQPKKAPRGRLLDRKQEQTPSKTYTFISKYQSPQAPMGQQESLAKPLHLWSPRSSTKSDCRIMGETSKPSKIARRSTKPVCHVLGGTASKTARAAEGSLLQFTRYSFQDNKLLSSSSQGDHQMSWFSDLNLEDSEPLLCKQEGKTLFYDLGFDSSDDDF